MDLAMAMGVALFGMFTASTGLHFFYKLGADPASARSRDRMRLASISASFARFPAR